MGYSLILSLNRHRSSPVLTAVSAVAVNPTPSYGLKVSGNRESEYLIVPMALFRLAQRVMALVR